MVEKVQQLLNDSKAARWAALILIALMMFFGYMFVDVMAPIKSTLWGELGWDSGTYGTYRAAEYFLNVCGFLIIAGIILDKMGVRFTGLLSASLMVVGGAIKFIGISEWFQGTSFCAWLDQVAILGLPGSAVLASLGFMIFGCGCEMAGTTVSKAIAKWFKGKEMAMAMGVEMAIARVGVFSVFSLSPIVHDAFLNSSLFGHNRGVVACVAFGLLLLIIGLLFFSVFCVMDKKFDKQLAEANAAEGKEKGGDEFKIKDLGTIFSSLSFWVVALLCVLYYSAIFPFQAYGAEMLQCNLDGISAREASGIFRWFPIGAAIITPFLGSYLDRKGKGATMLIYGALLLIVCHLVFAFVLPATDSKLIAYATIVVLGISFALVPAALWPSVPKIINEKVLGSAYCLIFWVQNIGLCFVPMIIGNVLESVNAANPGVIAAKEQVQAATAAHLDTDSILIPYDYTVPLIIFACFGVAALAIAIYLKALDRKRDLGLEKPNIVKAEA